MRVFVTGATGFIGSAVVRELIDAGHQVVGLARSETGAAALTTAGAEVRRGTLEDLDVLREAAAEADGVIHTAFVHDFDDFAAAGQIDRRAIEAMGEALVGSNRPFVVTAGTGLPASGPVATEDDEATPNLPRVSEQAALTFAERGVRVSVIRLPRSVHGEHDKGFVKQLIETARAKGFSAYPGDGASRWPAVHRLDAARLFLLALENAPAGARLQAVGDEAIPVRELAEIIGRRLNLPTRSIPADEAAGHFGFLGLILQMDCPASSTLTQKRMDWHPEQPGLIADLTAGHYFGD